MDPKEYKGTMPACFEKGLPRCPAEAVIPTMTVETDEGIKKLSNTVVHVIQNNTTYYVDDKHRITQICSEPVERNNYDFVNNPEGFRGQMVFDYTANRAVYFNNAGQGFDLVTDGIDFNTIKNRPKYNNVTMTSSTNIPKVPARVSELANDLQYQTKTQVDNSIATHNTSATAHSDIRQDITDEATARSNEDTRIWNKIETIEAASDVVDVVGTYAELEDYDTSTLTDNDLIKVLQDETHDDAVTYYRWSTASETFTYVGEEGPYYTQSETDALLAEKQDNLIAGSNIQIAADGKTISATDTTYTAGNGLDLTGTEFSVDNSVVAFQSDLPTHTSELTNDGDDGTSPYATQEYVDVYGGKIDKIEVNGVEQEIIDKTVDIIVPTKTSDLTNDGGSGSSSYVEAADLATVATSGSYNDLSDKPTIGNATLTIKRNNSEVGTFTANATTNGSVNITVPTKTSDITNDGDGASAFATESYVDVYGGKIDTIKVNNVEQTITDKTVNITVPTKTSDLTNDSNFPVDANYVHTDNNFTTALKNKLDGIAAGAEVNVQSDWSQTNTSADDFIKNKPTKTSDFTNDGASGTSTYVEADALATDLATKQDKLIAGTNIQIAADGKTISATDTTYSVMTGAGSSTAGASGLVPAPAAGDNTKYLSGDGVWKTISQYELPIASANTLGGIKVGSNLSIDSTTGVLSANVNNATLTIQKNGSSVGTFTANASSNKSINITVPTTAADVSALPASTKYGANLSLTIDDEYKAVTNPTGNPKSQGWYERTGTSPNYYYVLTNDTTVQSGKTYYTAPTWVITGILKDQDGNTLGNTQSIDLPLESVVVSGRYDSQTKEVILTLEDGSEIKFSVADLVSGLQAEITSSNKLSADLVDDTNATHKFTTAANLTKLAGIAAGAEVNVQSDWDQSNSAADDFIKNKPTIPDPTDYYWANVKVSNASATNTTPTFARSTYTGNNFPHLAGNGQYLAISTDGEWETGHGLYSFGKSEFRAGSADSSKLNLGSSSSLWKNLYLSGDLYHGTYQLTLPNKAGTVALTSDIPAVDSALSDSSTNPVQNKVIKAALDGKNKIIYTASNVSPEEDTPSAWGTALGGNGIYWTWYSQTGKFTNQPSQYGFLMTVYQGADIRQEWFTQTGGTHLVRTGNYAGWSSYSGSTGTFKNLGNAAPGNATLTIQKNGSTVTTFTADATADKTANITVPTKTSDLTNDGADNTSTYVEADELATVATSGSYNDLTNKPTIPTVNNATLTIQKNGSTVKTFTANASSNVTANITVPTNTNELTNGAGFITASDSITGNAATATNATNDSDGNAINSTYLKKSGGAMTGAITRALASSGTIAKTNLFTLTGSTDGLTVDYAATTADQGITTISTTDDANAAISIGNTISGTYTEVINVSNKIVSFPQLVKFTRNTYPMIGGNGTLYVSADGTWGSGHGAVLLSKAVFRPSSEENGNIDIGASNALWKNLYLSGDLYHGSTKLTLPSTAGTLALTSQIPTVNNATLTIQKNGTAVDTFTANASADKTVNITTDILVNAGDKRASLIPSDAPDHAAQLYFTSEGGLDSQTNDSKYCDALFMNTWSNTEGSGGRVNALVTTKINPQAIYHYTGVYNGSTWSGKKRIAYADEISGCVYSATCSTAAATAAKDIVVPAAQNFVLKAGATIVVKFTNTNTANNPTFSVNSTAAKSVYFNTGVITTGSLNRAGYASRYTTYTYDGTNWVWVSWGTDDNTTYSNMSVAEGQAGTATSQRTMRADYLKQIIEYYAPPVITITKTLTGNTAWTNTGIAGPDLETGTYAVQVNIGESSSFAGLWNERWSGIMSWYASATNNTNADEILLHNAGHADNTNEFYLRTKRDGETRDSTKYLSLQYAFKQSNTGSTTITFKFRRLI